jgi:hypothetical protein
MERLGSGGISAHAGHRQCERDLPLLSQADASAFSTVRFAHQYRSRNPALPISTPSSYSSDLAKQIGEFHTQGIAEDTKALTAGVLDDKEYLEQAHTVLAEHRRAFDAEFPKFHDGLFFFYFSSLDLNGHMMWRLTDPQHPAYDAALAAQYGTALEEFYEQIDQVLGEVMPKVDEQYHAARAFGPWIRSLPALVQSEYVAAEQWLHHAERKCRRRCERALLRCGLEPHARLWVGVERTVSEYSRTRARRHCRARRAGRRAAAGNPAEAFGRARSERMVRR